MFSILKNKKGIATWVSWVLLIAFVVGLSAMMYTWMSEYSQKSSQNMKKIFYDTQECDYIALNVDGACYDSSSNQLIINVSNRQNIKIDSLVIRTYSASAASFNNTDLDLPLSPGRKKTKILNITTDLTGGKVDIIPVIEKEGITIHCSEKGHNVEIDSC